MNRLVQGDLPPGGFRAVAGNQWRRWTRLDWNEPLYVEEQGSKVPIYFLSCRKRSFLNENNLNYVEKILLAQPQILVILHANDFPLTANLGDYTVQVWADIVIFSRKEQLPVSFTIRDDMESNVQSDRFLICHERIRMLTFTVDFQLNKGVEQTHRFVVIHAKGIEKTVDRRGSDDEDLRTIRAFLANIGSEFPTHYYVDVHFCNRNTSSALVCPLLDNIYPANHAFNVIDNQASETKGFFFSSEPDYIRFQDPVFVATAGMTEKGPLLIRTYLQLDEENDPLAMRELAENLPE